MTTIAVDAMGGDHAPRPEVEGAPLAAREQGVRVLLVGQTAAVKHELAKHSNRGLDIEVVPPSEVITMQDSPTQTFCKQKVSTQNPAAKTLRTAQDTAFVTTGK